MDSKLKIKTLFKKIKIEYLVVLGLGIIAVVIFLSSFSGESKKDKAVGVDEYVSKLEKKLEESLSKMEGAGKVKVIISVKSGMTTVLATEKQNKSGQIVESPILVNGKTVALSENYPEIIGVVIICQGADNFKVKLALLNATSCYLNVEETKIEILTMK